MPNNNTNELSSAPLKIEDLLSVNQELAAKFERFHIEWDGENEDVFNQFLHDAFRDLSNFINADISYLRLINAGQEDAYIKPVIIAARWTTEIEFLEIRVQVENIAVESTSIAGHLGSTKRLQFRFPLNIKRVSDLIETWQIDNVDDERELPFGLAKPTKEIQATGYDTGSMFNIIIRFPGDPVGRLLQYVRVKDQATGKPVPFRESEVLILELCSRFLVCLLKNLEEYSKMFNADLIRAHAAKIARENFRLKAEVKRREQAFEHQSVALRSALQTIHHLNESSFHLNQG